MPPAATAACTFNELAYQQRVFGSARLTPRDAIAPGSHCAVQTAARSRMPSPVKSSATLAKLEIGAALRWLDSAPEV